MRIDDPDIFRGISDNLPELECLRKQIRGLVGCSAIQWWGDRLSVSAQVGYALAEPDEEPEFLVQRAQQSVQNHAAYDKSHSCGLLSASKPPGS